MSLTTGRGPFGREPAGEFNFHREGPAHVLYWEPEPRRIRGLVAGETVVDSRGVRVLHETGILPRYYFPLADVRMDLLVPNDHSTHCPFKGDASYWDLRFGDVDRANAAWGYPEPLPGAPDLRGYLSFYWEAMDGWLQEDEPAVGHARDPYSRIDVLQSSARVRISIAGVTIADSARPRALFESNLPTRWYIPREDVREELLRPSERSTVCAYKGTASYASVDLGGHREEDVAWWYDDPLADAERVAGCVCFFDERVDVELDGVLQQRPVTPWSR
jgi:uncharacterized protein (DUF427 family)